MTNKEMAELFAAMSLAWPQAELFRHGVSKLGPTITLWSACLEEVDYWTAQKALVRLCRTCKFPPTIAELREKCTEVERDVQREISLAWDHLLLLSGFWELPITEVYKQLNHNSREKKVIDAMGGPSGFYVTYDCFFADGHTEKVTEANRYGFFETYQRLLRKQSTGLPAHTERRALKDG